METIHSVTVLISQLAGNLVVPIGIAYIALECWLFVRRWRKGGA